VLDGEVAVKGTALRGGKKGRMRWQVYLRHWYERIRDYRGGILPFGAGKEGKGRSKGTPSRNQRTLTGKGGNEFTRGSSGISKRPMREKAPYEKEEGVRGNVDGKEKKKKPISRERREEVIIYREEEKNRIRNTLKKKRKEDWASSRKGGEKLRGRREPKPVDLAGEGRTRRRRKPLRVRAVRGSALVLDGRIGDIRRKRTTCRPPLRSKNRVGGRNGCR